MHWILRLNVGGINFQP